MPLYDFFCDNCAVHREITMSVAALDRHDGGKLTKSEKKMFQCPKCKKPMRKLIAPVRLSSERCTLGY